MKSAIAALLCSVCLAVLFPSAGRATVACRDLVMQGRFARAVEECSAGIASGKLSKEELAAEHAWRGFAYVGTGDVQKAMGDFDRAIGMDPKSDTAYLGRGQVHEMKKDYKAARADLSRAIEINPASSAALAHRGMISYVEKRYEEALGDLGGPSNSTRRTPGHYASGEIRMRL